MESYEMQASDQGRIKRVLEAIITDGRITAISSGKLCEK